MMNRTEFENSLKDPIGFWGVKNKEEVKYLLGEEAARMVGFKQNNPHHCYDLFNHILHTVEGIHGVEGRELSLLLAAAFFHDIGKPVVVKEKDGRNVFYGHAKESTVIARRLLEQMGYSEDEIREICFYIGHHDDFIPWKRDEELNEQNRKYAIVICEKQVKRYLQKVEEEAGQRKILHPAAYLMKNTLKLCYADSTAQAELVSMNGKLVDTRADKQARVRCIESFLKLEAQFVC